ncbi:hypothetical protein CVT25_012011 [Psilocybe cyanescens]|uniref:Uncharacterized protein n=1 Tax=Psilocybe cyanescens TaxID=93625 RepID=A0A409VWG5_PSICY|nr:hypothetical protein CVT25_012011 [Psilocybe cyanescens]
MKFNVLVIASALLASASVAMSATITGFAKADCTGTKGKSFNVKPNECSTLRGDSAKSIRYSGVPNQIKFFISGPHDICTRANLTRGGGSGCATAPPGFNWESVLIS